MTKVDDYREKLRSLENWDNWLKENSGLPGPRGNLELAYAVALDGSEKQFEPWRSLDVRTAPVNSPEEFLVFCGVLGLHQRAALDDPATYELLRHFANDPRWRTRESTAMALQYVGRGNFSRMFERIRSWVSGSCLEQRALAAALCEPDLLRDKKHAEQTLGLLNEITTQILDIKDRKSTEFKTLRQGLGYCWSVAVAASPETGKGLMEKWAVCEDSDVRWIIRENLKKNRLLKMDAAWVEKMNMK